MIKLPALLISLLFLVNSCATFKKGHANNTNSPGVISGPSSNSEKGKTDTVKKQNKPKPYKELITPGSTTSRGLFSVDKVNEKYYFEIPDSLIGREILIVTRIDKAAADLRPLEGNEGYAGDLLSENVIRFDRGPNYKLFLKYISNYERAYDTTENGLHNALKNSSLQPIFASFDIKAYSRDFAGVVIDVTDFIIGDNAIFSFPVSLKQPFQLTGFNADKSFIDSIFTFPTNIEVKTVKTFSSSNAGLYLTYELNSSIVLLPDSPMKPRYFDDRVGYFYSSYYDFDRPIGGEQVLMINKWRLEPKEIDLGKYERGELVEPQRPIVFYIDPATPKKWIPYLIKGVNDWQKAFEQAGFKNAIYALEAPTNDSQWSLLDARHNAIIYKPSFISNASGPHIHDPRTGEILETHINWYHNVMTLIHDWYMIQVGAIDPQARKMSFDDSVMGNLIRFVVCHEVGHTLGLQHNFGASSTVPVDSLRSKTYLRKNGLCPSIMDYARFNYVAQPEDSLLENDILPKIGSYDKWAIEWGYRIAPVFKNIDEEKAYMNKWIINRLTSDPQLWFGPQPGFIGSSSDPRSQSEDLGDNAMKSGYYGIKNLKRIVPDLIQWTHQSNAEYSSLSRLYYQAVSQYQRYIYHVLANIGNPMWTKKTQEQPGPVLKFQSREKQKEAIAFLQENLFNTQEWLINRPIYSLIGGAGIIQPLQIQSAILDKLLTDNTYIQLSLWAYTLDNNKAYSFTELLSDLESGIWQELATQTPVSLCRRNLQKTYVDHLLTLYYLKYNNTRWARNTDLSIIVENDIKSLISKLTNAEKKYKDKRSVDHFKMLRSSLSVAIDPALPQLKLTVIPTGDAGAPSSFDLRRIATGPYSVAGCTINNNQQEFEY